MKILHVFTLATTAESFFDGQFGYIAEGGHELSFVAATEPDPGFCERNSITFDKVDIARRIDVVADLKAIRRLASMMRRERFDVVVGHTPKGAMVAMIASWIARVPIRVYYRHGLIYTTAKGLKRTIFKTVERLTACYATKIVNVSPSLSALAVKDHLNSGRKQTVIGAGTCGGIDAGNTFNPGCLSEEKVTQEKRFLGISDDDFVVGFCGRLCRDKGIVELIEGFKAFKSSHPDASAKLLLVGPFDSRDILPESIKNEIQDNPDFIATGNQPKEKLPLLYSLMDVFVFPSYREGFGMCVIEASAMEVPILVSRSHGCVDSIREGLTGQYIEISAESISDGISRMYSSPELRKKLGKGGRRFVLDNFDHSVMWPEIIKLYNSLK